MTPYQTLGVKPNATDVEITKAYRRQAKRWHPDRNVVGDDNAKAKYAAVDAAYKLLSDPDRRAHYDRTGDDSEPKHSVHDPAHAELCQLLQPLLIEVLQSLNTSNPLLPPGHVAKTHDVVAGVRSKLANMAANAEQYKKAVERGCETLRTVVDRFEVKEGANVLRDIARSQLIAVEAELIRVTADLEKFARAKTYLEGASYRRDESPKTAARDPFGTRMITWGTG